MCHNYDVIKRLSKQITYDFGVFIPVSIGAKSKKNRPRNVRVIVGNTVAPFLSGHGVGCSLNIERLVSKFRTIGSTERTAVRGRQFLCHQVEW